MVSIAGVDCSVYFVCNVGARGRGKDVPQPEWCSGCVETYLDKAGKDGGQEWNGLHLEVLDTNTWVGTGWDKVKDKIGNKWRQRVLSTQGA